MSETILSVAKYFYEAYKILVNDNATAVHATSSLYHLILNDNLKRLSKSLLLFIVASKSKDISVSIPFILSDRLIFMEFRYTITSCIDV